MSRYWVKLSCKWLLLWLSIMVVLLGISCSQQASPTDSVIAGDTIPLSFAETVEKAMPSVVYIFAEIESPRPGQFGASGSGVILDPGGYILTNRHVVEGARRAEVTLQDRSFYEVTDFWLDDTLDLAVIKIDAQGLSTIPFADPDEIQVGDWVIALGHPLGISPTEGGATVTVGVVSNLGRSFAIQGVPGLLVVGGVLEAAHSPVDAVVVGNYSSTAISYRGFRIFDRELPVVFCIADLGLADEDAGVGVADKIDRFG